MTPEPPTPSSATAATDGGPARTSLATLFFTVFLDLLGFGLVVPFLPGVARALGATDFVAALIGTSYSLMQFLFVPVWGRLSDRIGRRPVLLVSIAASAIGMAFLGAAGSLVSLFVARIASGIATANIAVAQAYIADSTSPELRARGMGLIGMAFGLGFILGPFVGGELGAIDIGGRPGALAAYVAAGLSTINFFMATRFLPESLPPALRTEALRAATRRGVSALTKALRLPGVSTALVVNFAVIFWFAGMEQTFPLFTQDGFGLGVRGTGRVLGVVGVVAAIVQGGLIHRLTRRFGEIRLLRVGVLALAAAFALFGIAPGLGVGLLFVAAGLTAFGSGLATPSTSSYVSRSAPAADQGLVLGALQSSSALGRAMGPAVGGLLYHALGLRAPYLVGALGLVAAAILTMRLSLARPGVTSP